MENTTKSPEYRALEQALKSIAGLEDLLIAEGIPNADIEHQWALVHWALDRLLVVRDASQGI